MTAATDPRLLSDHRYQAARRSCARSGSALEVSSRPFGLADVICIAATLAGLAAFALALIAGLAVAS
jgi:hypothetical protein